jgi:hypothetical protein
MATCSLRKLHGLGQCTTWHELKVFFCQSEHEGAWIFFQLSQPEKELEVYMVNQFSEEMKIVIWRMVHDCLPMGIQLQRRNIPAEDQCVFCGRSEYVEHIFLFCPFAMSMWDSVKEQIQLSLPLRSYSNMKQWIFDFVQKASAIQATTLAILCWYVWDVRNDARNGKDCLYPSRLASKILAYVNNIVQFCFKTSTTKRCDPLLQIPLGSTTSRTSMCC